MKASLEPARTALCLCGGGITGGMYEIGAITALNDFFANSGQEAGGHPPAKDNRPFSINDFDIFVGTSAGSFMATALAAGIRGRQLFRAILDEDETFLPFNRTDIYRFDIRQGVGIITDILGLLLGGAARSLRGQLQFADVWEGIVDALPAGVFSLRHYEKFLDRFLSHHGLPTRFEDVPRELYITANDLDSGHRVIFGQGELRSAPISTAICASSAIPLFFEPVRYKGRDYVDGAVGKIAHADVALARGADLVVIINPSVPFRNDPDREEMPTPLVGARHLRDKGMMGVWHQAAKMSTRTKLHQELRRYQASHPNATMLLIEPHEEEGELFLRNSMSFSNRRLMLRYGYESTARLLKSQRQIYETAFGRHAVRVDANRLHAPWELTA